MFSASNILFKLPFFPTWPNANWFFPKRYLHICATQLMFASSLFCAFIHTCTEYFCLRALYTSLKLEIPDRQQKQTGQLPNCRSHIMCLQHIGNDNCPWRVALSTLIKKKRKFSSYIRKLRMEHVAKSYMTNGLLIYGEIFAHFLIY